MKGVTRPEQKGSWCVTYVLLEKQSFSRGCSSRWPQRRLVCSHVLGPWGSTALGRGAGTLPQGPGSAKVQRGEWAVQEWVSPISYSVPKFWVLTLWQPPPPPHILGWVGRCKFTRKEISKALSGGSASWGTLLILNPRLEMCRIWP